MLSVSARGQELRFIVILGSLQCNRTLEDDLPPPQGH